MIDREMYEAAFALMARSRAFLAPPVELSVSEWSDRFAVLSRESSSQHGKYDSRVTPYLRSPMNVFSDKTIRRCVLMFASQLGKTTAINLMISRAVDLDPSPMIFVLPSLAFADSYAKTRIEPMFRDTPRLRGLLADKSANTGKNKLREKMFPGGYLTMVGSESTTELAGRPIKRAYLDEVDRLARNKEGDVVQLVRVRLTTFFDSEEVITSTPTLEGSSRIVTEYEAGTQEKYWIPCPLCNRHQILSFWRLTDEPIPQHTCEHCHQPSRQNEWLAQSQHGEWRPEKTVDSDGLPLTVRSFWLDCMVSPWLSWRDIREEYRAAKELNDVHRDPAKLTTFYNTRLCKPWKDVSGQRADADVLYDRLETYVREGTEYFDLPDPVRVVTCGVDTQDDRLEYTIYGFGLETEMWGIEHGIIWGDTTDQDVWNQLTAKVYNRELTFADGVRKKIDRIFIDRGGRVISPQYLFA